MDTAELEVRTPRSSRTHHALLIFLVFWICPEWCRTVWILGRGGLGVETCSEEGSFPTMTTLLYLPASQRAVEVMCFVPKRCNDMMTLGRLRGFEVWGWSRKLEAQCFSAPF